MNWKHCHHCNIDKPKSQVIADICLDCRLSIGDDERPISALLSSLFRQPKKKVVARARQGLYSP